jgi:hypothetical protein
MKKRIVKLTESDIERIVKRVIKESSDDLDWIKKPHQDYYMFSIFDTLKREVDSLVGKSVGYSSISGQRKFETTIVGVHYNSEVFDSPKRNELVGHDRIGVKGVIHNKSKFTIIFDNNINLDIHWAIYSTGEFDDEGNPILGYSYYSISLNDFSIPYNGLNISKGLKSKKLYDSILKNYPILMIKRFKKYGEL